MDVLICKVCITNRPPFFSGFLYGLTPLLFCRVKVLVYLQNNKQESGKNNLCKISQLYWAKSANLTPNNGIQATNPPFSASATRKNSFEIAS